jgi:hypothetical protein
MEHEILHSVFDYPEPEDYQAYCDRLERQEEENVLNELF